MPKAPFGDLLQYLRRLYPAEDAAGRTDGELLDQFIKGHDEDAFTVLVGRHGRMVLGVCRRLLGDRHLAEDTFQATFIVLARRASAIRSRTSLGTWLYAVAQRVALKARAKASALRNRERESATMARAQRLDEHTWQELRSIIDEEIGRLPEKYQAPLVLCYLEGKSHDRAAKELDCAKTTLERRLSRGRELLRKQLIRRGVTLSAAVLGAALSEKVMGAPVAALLTKNTVQAAVHVLAGKAIAGGCLTARALALAEEALVGMVSVNGKLLIMVLTLGLAIGGAGLAGYAGLGEKAQPGPVAKRPAVHEQAATPAKKDPSIAMDQYGDPLPDGAVARLGTARFRHQGLARALAYTADGKTLAGLTRSGAILWDAETGIERKRLPIARRQSQTDSMTISPDGTLLAVCERGDGAMECRIWDVQESKKIVTVLVPKGNLRKAHVCFTPDGKRLALGANGGKVVVMDVPSGRIRATFEAVNAAFYHVTVSPDSKTLALASDDARHPVQIWDIRAAKQIRGIEAMPAQKAVTGMAFSPNGKLLAFCDRERIYLADAMTGKVLRDWEPESRGNGSQRLAFTPDSTGLVSVLEQECQAFLWNVATGKLLQKCAGRHQGSGLSMALAPDGKTVAFGMKGPAIELWDVLTGKELLSERQGHDSGISNLAFAPDGKTLASAGDNQIYFWDTRRWRASRAIAEDAFALSYSPDGKQLATGSHSPAMPRLQVRDMATGKPALILNTSELLVSAAFTADGRKLFTLNLKNEQWHVRHWNLANGMEEKSWTLPHAAFPVYLTPNGKTAYGAMPGELHVYHLQSGRDQMISVPHLRHMNSLMPSPDGWTLASGTGGPNGFIQLWEVLTGKEILALEGHQGTVSAVAWSPDGLLLASGEENVETDTQTVRIWERASGKELARHGGFKTDVWALVFSPDGTHLVAGMSDSTILVWKVPKPASRSTPTPGNEALDANWTDLASADAGKGHRAVWQLVSAPKQALAMLRERVKPIAVVDEAKVRPWIADLDSETFTVRQAAEKKLASVGEQIRVPMQKALTENVTLETRRRLEQILSKMVTTPPAETLRAVRAIIVLERIGSPQAQMVLEAMAGGAPGARETEEARESLERVTKRASK